jgi:hypothetical protein
MVAPRSRAFPCCTLIVAVALGCGGERDAASDGRLPEGSVESADPVEQDPAPGETAREDEAAAALVLPGPCHEPVPPQLCIAGEAVDAARDDVRLGSNSLRRVVALEGRLLATGEGAWPEGAPANDCYVAPSGLQAEPGSEIRLVWARLDVDGREAWLSISAPAESSPFVVGETLRVTYTELDDYLVDFGPAARSLTLEDGAGALLVWLGSAGDVDVLGAEGPATVELQLGAARCAEVGTCARHIQYALQVGIDDAASVLNQGDPTPVGSHDVLVGQSETAQLTGECAVEGTPQLASVALWRSAR